ncbi:AAA family ATPase [Nocardia wallacei]|uniref:AAA family ATPase n=1 Tax=Nocardia wallacei TaxID=480035 RepID=UPI002455F659|nr:AAA family ATPase [Nocardia wallacei]
MLVGRHVECATIQALLDRVRAGQGGGWCLRGDPGIGKTALLDFAADHAPGIRVMRVTGAPPESNVAYAALHRLLLPVMNEIASLPQPQQTALGVLFGRIDGAPPDRFLVGLATLTLLSSLADKQPILCLADDAQWIDGATVDVLAFVARRIAEEPVGILAATRTGTGYGHKADGFDSISIGPLDNDAAAAVLAAHAKGNLTPDQRRRILDVAEGNPLALSELPRAVLGSDKLSETMPLTARLCEAFAARVRECNEQEQQWLLLLAIEGTGRVDVIRAAAERLGIAADISDLEGLVVSDGPAIRFRHPLIRAATYHNASAFDRTKAHRALAAVLEGHADEFHRYAWHLGWAVSERNEDVADVLERSAVQAARLGGQSAGAAALERAAELSTLDRTRGRRLIDAAVAHVRGGDIARGQELLDRAEVLHGLSEHTEVNRAALRALLESSVGVPTDAQEYHRLAITRALAINIVNALPLVILY